jgi:hypothetical protein
MSPGDILVIEDKAFNKVRMWRVEGVYLGCVGQESLIELRNLMEAPGVPGRTGGAGTTFVPEPLLRGVDIYTPVRAGSQP